jgi:tripartite-type tricarboxylate transporter receptor subunit TctC
MKKCVKRVAILLGLILIGRVDPVFAQANFYEGKTLRIIVGFSAGGGYDTYTRLIARPWENIFLAIPSSWSIIWPGRAA